MELGQRIRAWRKSKGVRIGQLAAGIGVTNSAVSQWEKGYPHPSHDNLKKAVEYLGLSMAEFWGVPPVVRERKAG